MTRASGGIDSGTGSRCGGVLVEARREAGRCDGEGRVTLELAEPGSWLITAVYMQRAREGSEADWESVWASLTFELAAAAARPSPADG